MRRAEGVERKSVCIVTRKRQLRHSGSQGRSHAISPVRWPMEDPTLLPLDDKANAAVASKHIDMTAAQHVALICTVVRITKPIFWPSHLCLFAT